MKRLSLLILPLVIASVAHAHEVKRVKSASDSIVEKFRKYADSADDGKNVVSDAYKIVTVAPKKAKEKATATLERVVRWALHRDFPVTGDDGGYSFSRLQGEDTTEKDVNKAFLGVDMFSGDEASAGKLKSIVLQAAQSGLLVLVGTGSGNNTTANIVVIADPKNQEFVYLMESNFGSDE